MTTHMRNFKVIAGEGRGSDGAYYPGSSRRIRSVDTSTMRLVEPQPTGPAWDARPRVLRVGRQYHEFFSIGPLSQALNRSPVTIRKWERNGTIPSPTFVIKGQTERGNRRLYTREQVEGMIRIAEEEGILHHAGEAIHISDTRFSERVIALFKSLANTATDDKQAA
ncbi:MerR family transcriptional regulator [Streptomyces sp. WZ-12]|uniref:MerR family transcriptional regulator n=1 Tax=Streptomyces sp. WZ-12 TaxID=3030210 RepID=UPI002381776D|nr:MerR family transcriptional regulator [Streptomyces sp. WZ-12]